MRVGGPRQLEGYLQSDQWLDFLIGALGVYVAEGDGGYEDQLGQFW